MEAEKNIKAKKEDEVFKWIDLFKPINLAKMPPWHNLPKDVLIEVMSRVSSYEQYCICATCKNWWGLGPLTDNKLLTLNNKIPWMITWYKNHNPFLRLRPQFSLYRPMIDKTPYRFDKIKGCSIEYNNILVIKHGWVLYHKRKYEFEDDRLCMFSPFARKTIELPWLHYYGYTEPVATLHSSPSTKVVFLVNKTYTSELFINICITRHEKWTSILKKKRLNENLVGVVCIRPFFYIVTSVGTIVKCDIQGRCKFLVRSPLHLDTAWVFYTYHVIEHGGEVMLTCLNTSIDECHVFRFIWSENVWAPQTRLGERVIFIGVSSFLVSGLGLLKNMSDRIYYIDKKGKLVFFCLKDRKSCVCDEEGDFEYRGWLADNGKYRFFIEQPNLP